MAVYQRYLAHYRIEDTLFPYTDRFIQLLFADLKKRTKIAKNSHPKRFGIRMWCGRINGERIRRESLTASGWHRIREKKPMKCTQGLRDGGYKGIKNLRENVL